MEEKADLKSNRVKSGPNQKKIYKNAHQGKKNVKYKRKKHKKQSKKVPDCINRDLTVELSQSALISPKSGRNGFQIGSESPKQANEAMENQTLTKNSPPDDLESPKMNAFEFMMNKRHKIIGANSPGKEIDFKLSPPSIKETAVNKSARKKQLQDWSDRKGAQKRKREYDEVGNCINYKLNKRKKKFKAMLKNGRQSEKSDAEDQDDVMLINRKSKSRTDAENSNDSTPKVEKTRKKRESKALMLTKPKISGFTAQSPPKTREIDESIIDIDTTINNGLCEEKPEKRQLRSRNATPKYNFDDIIELEKKISKKHNEKSNKVAPVFVKSTPKPKVDPKIVEARRQFLLSSLPSNIKTELIKKSNSEEKEFDVFPSISHVQQLENVEFDLPEMKWQLFDEYKIDFESILSQPFRLSFEKLPKMAPEIELIEKLVKFKKIVIDLKAQNPNYPIYTVFKKVLNKKMNRNAPQVKTTKIVAKNGRGRPKKSQKIENPKVVLGADEEIENNGEIHAMWNEKYKPKQSGDILGNTKAIGRLKNWLQSWTQNKNSKKNNRYDSESEFDTTTDGESCDSVKTVSNSVILAGPSSAGKSSAVFAVCHELGLKVLEVNASTRRTGKLLLQALQEATQSHQVRKAGSEPSRLRPKMCVLLIEDIDVVFEQDDGFLSALTQIMQTSKRPFILTTSDPSALNIHKFITQYEIINFVRVKPAILSIWLQLVCLVEGVYIDRASIEELYVHNRSDARKTLLCLQLWAGSGGQFGRQAPKKAPNLDASFHEVEVGPEDASYLSDTIKFDDLDQDKDAPFVHSNCVQAFENVRSYGRFRLPDRFDMEANWWNLPNLLNLPKVKRMDGNERKLGDREKLKSLARFYDSFSLIETISREGKPNGVKDSLELSYSNDCFKDYRFIDDLKRDIFAGRLELHKKVDATESGFDMAVPPVIEQKWLLRRKLSDEVLREALPKIGVLGRRETIVDYLPMLRDLGRLERERAKTTTKRRNRFNSALKSFGVNCSESILQFTCDVFNHKIPDD